MKYNPYNSINNTHQSPEEDNHIKTGLRYPKNVWNESSAHRTLETISTGSVVPDRID